MIPDHANPSSRPPHTPDPDLLPTATRWCNLHADCGAADKRAQERGACKAVHCWTEDCYDCFGQ